MPIHLGTIWIVLSGWSLELWLLYLVWALCLKRKQYLFSSINSTSSSVRVSRVVSGIHNLIHKWKWIRRTKIPSTKRNVWRNQSICGEIVWHCRFYGKSVNPRCRAAKSNRQLCHLFNHRFGSGCIRINDYNLVHFF